MADDGAQHLTNSNFVVVASHAITAGRGLSLGGTYEDQWRTIVEFRESGRAVDEGLVSVAVDGESRSPEMIPVKACRQITAIAAAPDGEGFVTGGLDGELDRWSWKGGWRQERLREWSYDSEGIIAICHLSRGNRLLSVSRNGEFDLMAGSARAGCCHLPRLRGSLHALTAHPDRNWVAVGIDRSNGSDKRGFVDIIEIEWPAGS